MDIKDVISKIAEGKIPKKPEFLLRGSFAFSHRGEFESTNQPVPPNSTAFVSQTQAGYLTFDGQGGVDGKIKVNRNGGTSEDIIAQGSYTVEITNNGIATGIIKTAGNLNAAAIVKIEYYFVVADNWKELKYSVQKAEITDQTNNSTRQPKVLAWGTMRKIYS